MVCNVKLNYFLEERYEVHTSYNKWAHFNSLPRYSYILIRIIFIKMGNRQMFDSGSYYTGTARIGRSMKLTIQIPVLPRLKKKCEIILHLHSRNKSSYMLDWIWTHLLFKLPWIFRTVITMINYTMNNAVYPRQKFYGWLLLTIWINYDLHCRKW